SRHDCCSLGRRCYVGLARRPSCCSLFFFTGSGDHRDLHSFPTRRSSDLSSPAPKLRTSRATEPRLAAICVPTSTTRQRSMKSLRSEEHTSELQSPYDLVCRLLLEKKKKNNNRTPDTLTN